MVILDLKGKSTFVKMNTSQHISDSLLLKRVAVGDKKAYKLLYNYYSPNLIRYILTFVKNSKEDAEEIVQDLFLKIWIKKETLININSFEAYLFRMAKNELINRHVRQTKLNEIVQLKSVNDLTETESVHEKVVYDEYLEAAQLAIEQLSPQRRKIFEMRTQMDMPIEDIAVELNITKSAVKKQLYEAIHFMKNQLHHVIGWPLIVFFISFIFQLLK